MAKEGLGTPALELLRKSLDAR